MARVTSGQMDGADLTLGALKTICASFTATLSSMMHTRIDYPEDDESKRKKSKGKAQGKGKRSKEPEVAEVKDENLPGNVSPAGKVRVNA